MPDNSPKPTPTPAPAIEHDNTPLIPYLKQIAATLPKGLAIEDADKWPDAKKLRQVMYISGTAVKANGRLVLTEKGKVLISGN